jgi:hypothetical protein
MIHGTNVSFQSAPIIHFDTQKGIKYVYDAERKINIPFLEEMDIKYISFQCDKTEKLLKEWQESQEIIRKNILELKSEVHFAKEQIEEQKLEGKRFDQEVVNSKLDLKLMMERYTNCNEKYKLELEDSRKLLILPDLTELDFKMTQVKDQIENLERVIRIEKNSMRKKHIHEIIYYLGVGLLIHFGGLILCYSTLLAKKGTSLLIVYAMKTINLTRYKIFPPEN